jgi:hypothetical protein
VEPSVITAITGLFTAVNGWQAGTVLVFIFFVPPVFAFWAFIKIATAVTALKVEVKEQQAMSEKHFSAFVNKYENNILLVKNYEKLAGDLSTIIHLNTQAITRIVDRIDFSHLRASVNPKGTQQ